MQVKFSTRKIRVHMGHTHTKNKGNKMKVTLKKEYSHHYGKKEYTVVGIDKTHSKTRNCFMVTLQQGINLRSNKMEYFNVPFHWLEIVQQKKETVKNSSYSKRYGILDFLEEQRDKKETK